MKKLLVLVLALALALTSVAALAEFPDGQPIHIYVCSGESGATSLGINLLKPYLEKEFGTSFVVEYEKGGGGFICWLKHQNDKPDGYTWIVVNDTMDFAGLNPQTPQTLNSRDFQLLGCQVVDISALAGRADEDRWTDLASLIEYAKENEVTVSVSALGNEDANVIYLMNNKLGTKFELVVNSQSSAACIADVIGGHVDLYSNNVASADSQVKQGSMKALCVFNNVRSQIWPDVPTFEEVTGIALSSHSARGIMMPKGGDEALVQRLIDGIAKCTQDPEYVSIMAEQSLEVVYLDPAQFQELFDNSKADVLAIKDVLGW